MSDVSSIMTCDPVSCSEETRLQRVAELMRDRHVGAVIMVTGNSGSTRPVGVITDRDVVLEVVATGLDPAAITAGDIAIRPVVTIQQHEGLLEAIHKMRSRGVRRLPVVNLHGALVGIVTHDDVMQRLAHELSTLSRVAENQPVQEARARPGKA